MKKNPHRIEFTVKDGFKSRLKLLAAKWGVKTNEAVERAVDLALTRESTSEERTLLQTIASRLDDLWQLLSPK